MLKLQSAPSEKFEDEGLRNFEDEMVLHSRAFTPRLCEVLGEEQLRVALRQAITRAHSYGFTFRGPIRLYIELMFIYGSGFDTDPQYPAIGEVLKASGDQMQRAEQIGESIHEDYREKVTGPGGIHVRKSQEAFLVFAQDRIRFSATDFVPEMLQQMNRFFPQKVAYTGQDQLSKLIEEGREEARRYGLSSVRAEAMIVVLMFAFGHRCTEDPLYPWIGRTLHDERIIDAEARARRLEKKAVTWLKHVLARPRQGVQS